MIKISPKTSEQMNSPQGSSKLTKEYRKQFETRLITVWKLWLLGAPDTLIQMNGKYKYEYALETTENKAF